MTALLKKHHDNGVLELILNRPEKKNALTLAMYQALTTALVDAAEDPQVRVVVLRGEGDSFTAGNDLADFMGAAARQTGMSIILGFLHQLVDFPKPLLAAVHGNAVGIGTTLLLHCDDVLVADTLRAQMPFVKLGLVPEGGSSLLLTMRLGHRSAFELLVEGAPIDAQRALALGIASEICAQSQLQACALAKAAQLAALPSQAVVQSKAMLKAPWREQLHRVIEEEGQQFAERLASAEAQAVMAAFFERR